jgi:hypothetical protein
MEALKAMLAGKKVCAHNWDSEDNYLEIQGNKIVSPISNDGESVFNSWEFNDENEWREYVVNNWKWKVADIFRYEADIENPSHPEKFKVLFVNEQVCFCMSLSRVKYDYFDNDPLTIARMTKI